MPKSVLPIPIGGLMEFSYWASWYYLPIIFSPFNESTEYSLLLLSIEFQCNSPYYYYFYVLPMYMATTAMTQVLDLCVRASFRLLAIRNNIVYCCVQKSVFNIYYHTKRQMFLYWLQNKYFPFAPSRDICFVSEFLCLSNW